MQATIAWIRAWVKILACTRLHGFGAFLKQALIDLALHVRGYGDPFLPVDHLHDSVKDRGIADFVDHALKDLTEDVALLTQLFQRLFYTAPPDSHP
jgi:hypothetical protein